MSRYSILPTARDEKTLVVQELADETVVYDQIRHTAHYLDRVTAFVWKHCDGKTKVGEVARLLSDVDGSSGALEVRCAIGQLKKYHLID